MLGLAEVLETNTSANSVFMEGQEGQKGSRPAEIVSPMGTMILVLVSSSE